MCMTIINEKVVYLRPSAQQKKRALTTFSIYLLWSKLKSMASSCSNLSCTTLTTFIVLVINLNVQCSLGCYTAILGFGDSLTDTGNLVLLSPPDKPPHMGLPPYGETFFHRPTGRSSDGRLIIDFMGLFTH